jgi:hypothetical protein
MLRVSGLAVVGVMSNLLVSAEVMLSVGVGDKLLVSAEIVEFVVKVKDILSSSSEAIVHVVFDSKPFISGAAILSLVDESETLVSDKRILLAIGLTSESLLSGEITLLAVVGVLGEQFISEVFLFSIKVVPCFAGRDKSLLFARQVLPEVDKEDKLLKSTKTSCLIEDFAVKADILFLKIFFAACSKLFFVSRVCPVCVVNLVFLRKFLQWDLGGILLICLDEVLSFS